MIQPIKSPVRPRVIVKDSGEITLLEELVATLAESRDASAVAYYGKAAVDTETALQHIACLFGSDASLRLSVLEVGNGLLRSGSVGLIAFGNCLPGAKLRIVNCELTDWGRDEWIEFLLSAHRDQCTSVMQRLLKDSAIESLEGNTFILRLVLDELAADEQLPDVNAALRRIINKKFVHKKQREDVSTATFTSLIGASSPEQELSIQEDLGLSNEQACLLRVPAIQLMFASESAVEQLQSSQIQLEEMWPRTLVTAVAPTVSKSEAIQSNLQKWVQSGRHPHLSLAVSLLNAAAVTWKWPQRKLLDWNSQGLNLTQAILDAANCCQMPVANGSVQWASFVDAQLIECDLRNANGNGACFRGANMHHAQVSGFNGMHANFTGATMTDVWGKSANFCMANFRSTNLSGARLPKCHFARADLTGANLTRSSLRDCCFRDAILDDACFRHADLAESDFEGLDLTVADFLQASFRSTRLSAANLEEMELPDADFSFADLHGALLTASVMPRANFHSAVLINARMAFVEWESVDLRSADLRGATFHMGSTRCGLVGSSIPMHGSRTEFYTDELHEQNFKSPEEIRKANLRGADLRGAIIDGVDFYLVDLRDARYDLRQEEQLRRTGAILSD